MKIAFVIRGVAYFQNYRHYTGLFYNIDWKQNKDGIIEYIDKLKETELVSSVDIFCASYENEEQNDIVEFFKPRRYIFKNMKKDETQIHLLDDFLQDNIELLKSDYDVIILSRFDIKLVIQNTILEEKIKESIGMKKIFFPFREYPDNGLIGDCFIVVPTVMLDILHTSIKNLRDDVKKHNSLHMLLSYLDNKYVDYIIRNEAFDSNTDNMRNPIYCITRNIQKNIPGVLKRCLTYVPRGLHKVGVDNFF